MAKEKKIDPIPEITDALDAWYWTPAAIVLITIGIVCAMAFFALLIVEGRLLNGKLRGDALMPTIAQSQAQSQANIASVLQTATQELKLDREQKRALEQQVYQNRLDMENLEDHLTILEGRFELSESKNRHR